MLRNKKLLLIILLVLVIGLVAGIYFLSERQDIRQRAAGNGADLIVTSILLTDAAGNAKTTFYEHEDIYVRVSIRNQGDDVGTSPNGRTYSQIYSNRSSPVAFNTPSDVNVSLDNGEFQPEASTRNYESRINGRNQGAYIVDPYDTNATRKYSWRKTSAGTYTARVLLNFDQSVVENDYQNNQASIQYSVVPFTPQDEIGSQTLTKPADFDDWPCLQKSSAFIFGLTGCIQRVAGPDSKVQGRITNNTANTVSVAIASYKAYLPYSDPGCSSTSCPQNYDYVWTQTFHRAELYDLRPGDTVYLSTNVPSCAWQADIFINGFPKSYHPNINTYNNDAGSFGYIDGWYHFYPTYDQNNTTFCEASIPEPTPTITQSPSPTPIPSVTPTPNPSITISPTPPACVAPEQVTNIQVTCPICDP